MDAATYLDRLLDMLGDSDLSDDNKAAAPYLQALRDLKSSMPRLGLFGAKPWPEAMVATALASTRPAAPRHMRELEDPARAAEIRRWNSRVTQFVEHGLIRRDRRDGLLMDTTARAASGKPAIGQCAPDQAAMIRSTLKDALDVALLKSATVENILRHLPASGHEADVPAPASIAVGKLSGDDAQPVWQLVRSASGFEAAVPRQAPHPRGRTDDFATTQRFSKA
ncbi:hypothetical protein [Roseateles sp.]|uniref:hypothetical protein n=1 Tax=Roseateles sp. TaxID=1971397 RepID=UPI002F3F69F1